MQRRSFLGLLGMAPVAAPMAAKAAIERADAELVGVTLNGVAKDSMLVSVGHTERSMLAKAASVLNGVVPDWKKRQLREEAKSVRYISPDVATLRSVSLSSKIRIQRERDYNRYLREFEDRYFGGSANWFFDREEFNAKHGVWL